ncbi:hypothetical protein VZT92_027071 [Zoarces viviparus]|uniref:Uncharacterized protein n=1 Tax=Zoarces viviparus TaxID=48416 RepID=A0AAW1DU16_ZOAVI
MEGGEDTHLTPFKAPTSASPSTGGMAHFEESTFHVTPQFLTKKEEEFGTYASTGLRWRDAQTHLRSDDLFSGRCGHTVAASSTEDRITD